MTNNLTPEQIEHMVDRFLRWKLPEKFRPDAGISFKPDFNENTPWPSKHKPSGTNLFDCNQATEMVKFMIEGLPVTPNQVVISEDDAVLLCVACDLVVGDYTRDETEMSEIHFVDEYFMIDFYKMADRLRAKLEGK